MDVDVGGASVSDSEGCGSGPSSSGHGGQSGGGGGSKLKRSSSAPMINQLVPQGPVSAPPTPSSARWGQHLCSLLQDRLVIYLYLCV